MVFANYCGSLKSGNKQGVGFVCLWLAHWVKWTIQHPVWNCLILVVLSCIIFLSDLISFSKFFTMSTLLYLIVSFAVGLVELLTECFEKRLSDRVLVRCCPTETIYYILPDHRVDHTLAGIGAECVTGPNRTSSRQISVGGDTYYPIWESISLTMFLMFAVSIMCLCWKVEWAPLRSLSQRCTGEFSTLSDFGL